MNIVYSSNDNYARHLAASMLSVIDSNRDEKKIDFYILNVGLSEDNINNLTSVAQNSNRNIHFVDFSDIKKRLKSTDLSVGSFSIEMYCRLFLADALPISENRVLWIDCDTIIKDNLHEIYFCDMGTCAIGAVIDQPNFGIKVLCEDAEIPEGKYYNSGIILANLDLWRQENLSSKFTEYIAERISSLSFPDQSILNHVMYNKIYTLPIKYNTVTPTLFLSYKKMLTKWGQPFYSKTEYNNAKKKPVIIHYTNFRPWKKWCLHPLKKYYRQYLKMTPYKDIPLEDDGFFNTFGKFFASVKAKLHI